MARPTYFPASIRLGLATIASLAFAGCANEIGLRSDPPGATVLMNGQPVGPTPTRAAISGDSVAFEFRLDGYFPEAVTYSAASSRKEVAVHLEPATLERPYSFVSRPQGATVAIDGRIAGTTPLEVRVVFSRPAKDSEWIGQRISVSKANYQTETALLSPAAQSVPEFDLALLRDERVYEVAAATEGGEELNAEVFLDGKPAGTTPLKLPVVFLRADKSQPWPRFALKVGIQGKYKPYSEVIDFARSTEIRPVLKPITEIATAVTRPAVVMTPTGVAFKCVRQEALAILDSRETSEVIAELTSVTRFERRDLDPQGGAREQCINSFCVTPDGHHVVFSVTEKDERGLYFSNLFIKSADDASGGVSRLTQGTRYLDTLPRIANDGSNFLVFASNRGDRNKPDVFRVNLVDNRISGGIARLTNDNRFNFAPTYGDSNRQIFYLSTEPDYPVADQQVSSVRVDGSLPTQLPVTAFQIDNNYAPKVFFVRADSDTRKKQIYSITSDGKLETALIGQEEFRQADCFDPAASADGRRVLFVSDSGVDEQGRHNNDVYLVNSDGTGVQRLTQNGSDDIMPQWSPSEDGVVYFLSNRGGTYNIWRLKLSGGSRGAAPPSARK